MGYTGLFSFAHASFAGIGGYTSVLLTARLDLPVALGPVAGAVASGAAGLFVGILCLRLRGFYLVLVTWAVAVILETLVQAQYQLTGGMRGIEAPPLFQSLSARPYYILGAGLAVACVAATALLVRSRVGLYLRAIRDDQDAAEVMGVDTVRWKVVAFAVGSSWAGAAGAFYAHQLGIIDPSILALDEMAKIILMVIVGGSGTLGGPVLGALFVTLTQEFIRGQAAALTVLLFSLLMILVVRFAREGILPTLLSNVRGRARIISSSAQTG
jgi:branched-chain amino acid transport system permease protein